MERRERSSRGKDCLREDFEAHSNGIRDTNESKITARERATDATLAAMSGQGGAGPKVKKGQMEDWNGKGEISVKRAADDAVCLYIVVTRTLETLCEHHFFLNMLRAVNAAGPNYPPPPSVATLEALGCCDMMTVCAHPKRGYVGGAGLLACKQQIEKGLMPITKTWKEIGVTIAGDMMTDKIGRVRMNIISINVSGAIFQEAVDCKVEIKSGVFIVRVLQSIIEKVGSEHIVAICMDGGSNYVSAGKLLQKNPHIEIVPCATHVLDLLMEDFSKMDWA
ncbi:unnamed protein product [Closterium sp. Yama58-4]|nr:unnamed protein product [Closterium sp. Yama58-4]